MSLPALASHRTLSACRWAATLGWALVLWGTTVAQGEAAATYRLEAPTSGTAAAELLEGTATAFVVAPGLLITNEHVVRGHDRLGLRDVDSNVLTKATVLVRDRDSDLALLQAAVTAKQLPIALAPAKLRDLIAVIGYPDPRSFGIDRKLAQGWVRELTALKHPELFTLDVAVRGGNSGSPILSRSGQVVGVITGSFTDTLLVDGVQTVSAPIAAGAKQEHLVRFLRENNVPFESFAFQGALVDIAATQAKAVYLVEVLKPATLTNMP